MRVVVDYDLCESNAVCMGILPEVFEVRDDDFLYLLNEQSPEEYRETARAGGCVLSEAGHLHRRGLSPAASAAGSLAR